MSETQADTITKCESCGEQSPSGLLFCPFCGVKVEDPERDSGQTRYNCPFCHCADEFSRAFCTVCGAQINQGEANMKLRALGKRTGFNWSMQSADQATTVRLIGGSRNSATPESESRSAARSPLLMYCAIGIVVGLAAAALCATAGAPTLNYLLARFICPQRGLVVAVKLEDAEKTQQPNAAQIKLQREGDSATSTFTTDDSGLLSATNLAAGKYRMYVTAPGYETAFAVVNIEGTRPTLIGFPAPLVLPHP